MADFKSKFKKTSGDQQTNHFQSVTSFQHVVDLGGVHAANHAESTRRGKTSVYTSDVSGERSAVSLDTTDTTHGTAIDADQLG